MINFRKHKLNINHAMNTQPFIFFCPALEDLNCDGNNKLLVGDLGSGEFDMKLKVYQGKYWVSLYA